MHVEFVELGEGYYGEYGETNDPDDQELLRIDFWFDDDRHDPDNGNNADYSYCTDLPVTLTERERVCALRMIAIGLQAVPSWEKSLLQRVTWASNIKELKQYIRDVIEGVCRLEERTR